MDNSNKNKYKLLGEPHGTAVAKLKKAILFQLIQETGKDVCYRCYEKIEHVNDLSIEHKESWQYSSNPREFFYDLNNISFSHVKCNRPINTNVPHYGSRGENCYYSKLSKNDVGEIRNLLESGYTAVEISKKYNINKTAIGKIKRKETWKD